MTRQIDIEAFIFGKRIKSHRQQIGMSQKQLGSLIGVSRQQISKYERGLNRVPETKHKSLYKALETTKIKFEE